MAKKVIFEEETPLGHRVVLTRDRWREIVRFKHPALDGHENEVQNCVSDPEARFVVTAYFTNKLKKGRELWTK